MKKHVAAFAVMALTAVQAGWGAGLFGIDGVKSDASIEVKGMQADNEFNFAPANDRRGGTNTRLRAGLTADIVDNFRGRLELLRATGQFGQGPATVGGEEGMWSFQNAYLEIAELFTFQNVRLGRQYAGRHGDLLAYFGPNDDDSLTTMALDGLSAVRMLGPVRGEFVTAKIAENQAVSQTEGTSVLSDANVTWLTLGVDPLSLAKGDKTNVRLPVEVGIYQGSNRNTAITVNDNNTLLIYDLRASLVWDMFDVGLEYAMNDGQLNGGGAGGAARDYNGNAYVLHANVDNKEVGFGVHLGYANASGDDLNETNPLNEDDTFHDFATIGAFSSDYRYGEILSNSNALGFGAGLDTGAVGPGLNVLSLSGYYDLPFNEKRWRAEAGFYSAKVNETISALNVDDGVGNEIDVSIRYHYSDNVGMRAGYATFSPDKGFVNGFIGNLNLPDDSVTKLFASLYIKFGDVDQRSY